MFKDKISILILLIFLLLVYSCEGGKMHQDNVPPKDGINIKESLEKVSKLKIYFGHQSVGYNILDGIRDIDKEYPQIHMNIVESTDPSVLDKPVLMHSTVGHNTDPDSKLSDFRKFMDAGIGKKTDVAILKFCYVDMTQGVDVKKIFDSYKKTHDMLKQRYPNVIFVHVTAPLTSMQSDIKTMTKNLIKRVIGRPVRNYKDDIPRNQFNDLLRKEYEGKEPVFDLAQVESTMPDGKRVTFSEDGATYYALDPEYTVDGGHLNETGRKIVARKLIDFLAQLPVRTPGK